MARAREFLHPARRSLEGFAGASSAIRLKGIDHHRGSLPCRGRNLSSGNFQLDGARLPIRERPGKHLVGRSAAWRRGLNRRRSLLRGRMSTEVVNSDLLLTDTSKPRPISVTEICNCQGTFIKDGAYYSVFASEQWSSVTDMERALSCRCCSGLIRFSMV